VNLYFLFLLHFILFDCNRTRQRALVRTFFGSRGEGKAVRYRPGVAQRVPGS